MNLEKYFKEPAKFQTDLKWLSDGETFDVEGNHRNPHECKDELALQWGNYGFTVDSDEKMVSAKEDKKASVQNNIVQITRSLMNSGMKTADIREYLAKHQSPNVIKACSQEIDRQLRLEGSVGRFVLDARGYKNCSDALRFAAKNPFKKHLKYMIGCTCSNHIKTKSFTSGMMLSGGDPIGDTLNDKTTTMVDIKESCPKTGMLILSGQGDLDDQWAGDTMIDVMNACELDNDGVKTFIASADQPYMRLKKFFIALDNGSFSKKQESKLDMTAIPDTDLGQSPISFKIDNIDSVPVDINDNSGRIIKLNPDLPNDKVDVNIDSMNFGLDKDVKKEKDIDVALESMCFDLNKSGSDVEPVKNIAVGSGLIVDGFDKDAEKSIKSIAINPELNIDKLDDDNEVIPLSIPVPETNTFSLNNTEYKNISVNNALSPVEIDIVPTELIDDIDFSTPEDDELYCDGMISLNDDEENAGDIGMTFSF